MATFVNLIKHIIEKCFLLKEDGYYLLLEDGFKIILTNGWETSTKK